MKKLDYKTYRLRKLFDYISVILLIMLLMFIWQLYRGDVSIPFLKPYIIKALNHDNNEYQVTLDDVNLELVRSLKPLRIIAKNVSYRKADGSVSINAPKTSVSFSIKALLHGIIAPSSIDVYDPKVYIFNSYGINKEQAKEVNQKKIEYYLSGIENFLERFNSEDQSYPESFINDISINSADVELHEIDLGKKWSFSDVNYRFERGFNKLETEVNATLKINNSYSSLGLSAIYKNKNNDLVVQFYFADLVPANLLALLTSEEWQDNYKIDVPLSGNISARVNLSQIINNKYDLMDNIDKIVENVEFSIDGGQGHVAFSDKDEENFNIGEVAIKGEVSGGLNALKVTDANFELDGQKATLGIDIVGIKKYLLQKQADELELKLTAKVKKLATDDLFRYWPKGIAPDAWKWCANSLSKGNIEDASFTFSFGYDNQTNAVSFKDLNGIAHASGVSLDYLTGMPKVDNIYGNIEFYSDKLKMYFDKGMSADVILEQGYVELYDLNKDNNFAKINLQGIGSIADILKLIDNPPLKYTSEMGINPDIIKGSASANLGLEFEIKKNLSPSEVKVDVSANLQDVVISDVIQGNSIEAKNLTLKVDNSGLNISGVANYNTLPVTLLWTENFAAKDYLSRYQLNFNFDNNFRRKLGLDYSILGEDYIKGSIPAQATITRYSDSKIVADINGDLQKTSIDYSFLGFKKKSGEEGIISTRLDIQNGKLQSVPLFSLTKPGFELSGKIDFTTDTQIKNINIEKIKGPQTSAQAKISFIHTPERKIKINVSGNSYNLSDFFNKDDEEIKASQEKRRQKKALAEQGELDDSSAQWENSPDTEINIAVNNLWTNKDVAIKNFAGSAKILHGVGIHEMHLIGNFDPLSKKGKLTNLKLDYTPRPHKEYVLNIESNNAGATLKFLRLYENMKGGSLSINAKRDADKNFVGHAKMRDFNVYNTPVFAKLLTVASFSGMVNLLTGDGMEFSHFDAPFEYKNSKLKINEGKAFGDVVGISANGTYSLKFQEFDIEGLIAPAYGLNTFIGSIPLVGNLLSGKDGTVFAANYSISGDIDNPEISINPLSALSPNSLKELFLSIFGND
ncbi:MAG: DUF3971 domain-containing protein [Alphaproteobacteria bacterium]|nr:DUF3971 domain-containing protein [Alphaproteobacteria bacterium]